MSDKAPKSNVYPIRKQLSKEEQILEDCNSLAELQVEIEVLHDKLVQLGADATPLCHLRQVLIDLELWVEYEAPAGDDSN